MKVGVILAESPHLKTEQVTHNLVRQGHDVTIYTVPFKLRKKRSPLFIHRPNQFEAAAPSELAALLGLNYIALDSLLDLPTDTQDIILMTGGVLVPDEVINGINIPILNCHAGLIPECRGLDAFKWAVLNQKIVGNTLHKIDARVDMGEIFYREQTPVFSHDSLQSFAFCHYRNEIRILSDFADYIKRDPSSPSDMGEVVKPTMRMPAETETGLEAAFELYKQKYAVK